MKPARWQPEKRDALVDASIIVLGCAVYVAVSFMGVRIGYIIPAAIIALVAFCGLIIRRHEEDWRDFGFRKDNFWRSANWVGGFTSIAAVAILAASLLSEHQNATPALWQLFLLLPIYPAWGLIQQFIFQGILLRRLRTLFGNRPIAIVVNATVFSVIHVADWRVAILTFVAGLFWSWTFTRIPNLFSLALSHGILAAMAYYLVLGEPTLERVF